MVNSDTGEVLKTKLCTISGKVPNRTIRFYKKGLKVLKWFGFYERYMEYSLGHNLPSSDISVRRNHCIAETLAVMGRSSVEYTPFVFISNEIEGSLKLGLPSIMIFSINLIDRRAK